jgi:biopolymer transport protein ExbB/TolQ
MKHNKQIVMKSILFMMVFSACSNTLRAGDLCGQLQAKQKALLEKIAELKENQKKLLAEFDAAVEEDLQAQAEKIWQPWHREKATKVAFAKRKLEKKIEEETEKSEGLTKIITKKCNETKP